MPMGAVAETGVGGEGAVATGGVGSGRGAGRGGAKSFPKIGSPSRRSRWW